MVYDRAALVAELGRLREELASERPAIADRIGQILLRLQPAPTTLERVVAEVSLTRELGAWRSRTPSGGSPS